MKTSTTRLQDVLVKTNMFVLAIPLQDVFKTSWSRPICLSWPYVFKKSSRRLAKTSSILFQDVFKTSCKNVFKKFWRRLQKSSRHLQDVLKTSSRYLQSVLQRYLQDVFKMYHQVKLFLLTRLWEVFNTCLRRSFPKTK